MLRLQTFALTASLVVCSVACTPGGKPLVFDIPDDGAPPTLGERDHPDAIRRVFTRDEDGGSVGYAETMDGRRFEILPGLANLGGVSHITVSPDETKSAALVTTGTGEQDIYVGTLANPDDRQRITTIGLTLIADIMFCDGSVLFTAVEGGERKLFSARCDGSDFVVLANNVLVGLEKDAAGNLYFRSGKELMRLAADDLSTTRVSTAGDTTSLTRFQFGPDDVLVYSREELFLADRTRISHDTSGTGPIDATKVTFGRNGRYLVYLRTQAANGRVGAYLVDLTNPTAESVLISIPSIEVDVREVYFYPDGENLLIHLGFRAILFHHIGEATELLHDMGPDGRISQASVSPDGRAVAFGGNEDKNEDDNAHVIATDGSWALALDGLGEVGGRFFEWLPEPPDGGSPLHLYLARTVEVPQGFLNPWSVQIVELDFSSVIPDPVLFDTFAGPSDQGLRSMRFDMNRWLPGDDPYRGLDIEMFVGDLRFAADGIRENGIVPSYLGVRANYSNLSNNRVAPVRIQTDRIVFNYGVEAAYLGADPEFSKIWNVEVYPDGRVEMWEWAAEYHRLGIAQYSVGQGSTVDKTITLFEQDFPGVTEMEFALERAYRDVNEMFQHALGEETPRPKLEYTSDRVTRDRTWMLDLGPWVMY